MRHTRTLIAVLSLLGPGIGPAASAEGAPPPAPDAFVSDALERMERTYAHDDQWIAGLTGNFVRDVDPGALVSAPRSFAADRIPTGSGAGVDVCHVGVGVTLSFRGAAAGAGVVFRFVASAGNGRGETSSPDCNPGDVVAMTPREDEIPLMRWPRPGDVAALAQAYAERRQGRLAAKVEAARRADADAPPVPGATSR